MPLELIEIAVQDRQAHPRLAGRVTGHVRAVLTETGEGHSQTHELRIPVWADTAPTASAGDVDMALMLKAATIIGRLKQRLGGE